jgi:adenylate kinase
MLEGKLLSDDEMINMMDKVLQLVDTQQEFVLDGFPRTVPQADWLLDQVHKGRFALSGVIHLAASEDVVRERLMNRARQDDNEEAINQRFSEYRSVTLPIIEHFKKEGAKVFDIDASEPATHVHDTILACIDAD